MTRCTRRHHSPAYQSKVALAAIKGEHTLAELAEQFVVHPSPIATWKGPLLSGAAGVFGQEAPPAEPPVDVKSLHARIGELTLENAFFRRRAHQGGIAERKAMIDRSHPLSLTKQAVAAGIRRGSVYYPPKPVPGTAKKRSAMGI